MTTVAYPARLQHGVVEATAAFIDFDDLAVHATNIPDLLREARAALRERLLSLETADMEWPSPSSSDEAAQGGAQLLWVDVDVDDTPVRLTISMGERLIKAIDEAADAQGMTRSGFLAVASRAYLAGQRGKGTSKLYEEMSGIGRKVDEALGPESRIGRAINDLDARMLDGFRRMADTFKGGGTSDDDRAQS